MTSLHRLIGLAPAVALFITSGVAQAQDYNQEYYPVSAPSYQLFSAEELDNLVAPVALYPDPILAELFVAATFADQLDLAARHVRLFGQSGIDQQPWDVSVKSVAHYPPVLNMLVDRPDWTAAVGQAYAYQSRDLMDAVQRLRYMAHYQGNLVSTPQHTVIVERQVIRIVPAHPRVIYVPVYQPEYIYHRRAVFHAHVRAGNWSFGVSFPIGSWLSYDCDWLGRRVYYDGWRGGGWRSRSRPFVQIVNVYVNPRYEVINVNHTIINRTVNYVNLGRNNAVHRNVKFEAYAQNVERVVNIERQAKQRVVAPSHAQRSGAIAAQARQESQVLTRQPERAVPSNGGVTQQRTLPQRTTQAAPLPRNTERQAPAAVESQKRVPGNGRAVPQSQGTVTRQSPTVTRQPPVVQQPQRAPVQSRSAQQGAMTRQQPVQQQSQQRVPPGQAQRAAQVQQRVAVPPQRSAPQEQRVSQPQRQAPAQQRVITPQRSAPQQSRAPEVRQSPAQVQSQARSAPSSSGNGKQVSPSARAQGKAKGKGG